MKRVIYLFVLLLMVSWSCDQDMDDVDEVMEDKIDTPEGYSLLWQDEFNGDQIDTENWSYETGDGTDFGLPAGWGNNELQLYTDNEENSSIAMDEGMSVLKITADKTGDESYSSAKLVTDGKVSIRFGRLEVKAKLPEGQGIWPAIWMLGDNREEVDWPGCGEIDLVELLGHEPSKMYSTLHYVNGENGKGETQGSVELSSGSFSESYHVFAMDWSPEEIVFYIDDQVVHTAAITSDMKEFLRSFYLIANVAVGGFWPGNPDASTTFPQSMYIDYIRVFEKADFVAPAAPALDVNEESLGQNVSDEVAVSAVKEGFDLLKSVEIIPYGGGGEPTVDVSETAIDGENSVSLAYPGGSWGGAYMQLASSVDVSSYSHLSFTIQKPENIIDAEIKLESSTTSAAVYLINYTGIDAGDGFVTYEIPLSNFEGLDLSAVRIPFAFWNPVDDNEGFAEGTVLLDNVHFTD